MHRFYCPQSDFSTQEVVITDKNELHHLRDVLRLKKGDRIGLFNDKNEEAGGTIVSSHAQKVCVHISAVQKMKPQGPSIILACAVPHKGKFELIIEKTTELGVDEIIPLKTQRTQIALNKERQIKKRMRYQTVAVNAAKQSGRTSVPTIHTIIDFPDVFKHFAGDVFVFIPSLSGKRKNLFKAFQDIKTPKKIAFCIGPEGDFTPDEYALAQKAGCQAVSLGKTILKVETAAITAVACARAYYHNG